MKHYNDQYFNGNHLKEVATPTESTDAATKGYVDNAIVQSDWNQTDTSSKDFIKNKPDLNASLYEEVTYAQLLAKVTNSSLVKGRKYRITDYVTTTTQTDTQSAGHQFDIVVTAKSNSALYPEASALLHSGDTYFSSNNVAINKWQIWYDIENNTNRYDWADSDNGKGVIYRMIDEWENDCPYDFKNILFTRKLTNGDYDPTNGSSTWVYTFGGTSDASIPNNRCYSNILKERTSNKNIKRLSLLNTVFLGTDCYNNTFGTDCYNNTFGTNCHNNTFGSNCRNNTFKYGFSDNTLGSVCYGNTFGNYCEINTLGNNCNYNTFGNNCYNNTLGIDCFHITFGDSNNQNGDYIRCVIIESNKSIRLYNSSTASSSNYLQNVYIAQGVNDSNTYLDISAIARNLGYRTTVAREKDGTLRIYNEDNLVQSDWSQTDSTADDYIKNKPAIPSKTSDLNNDSGFITVNDVPKEIVWCTYTETDSTNNTGTMSMSTSEISSVLSSGKIVVLIYGQYCYFADSNLQFSSWFGENHFTFQYTGGGVWKRIDIGLQPTLVSGTNIKTINGNSILGSGNLTVGGGDVNVQSDWNQTDSSADDYIKNKPSIPSAPGTLVTNASTAQTASSGESMSGNITLHKISKTGSYNDLLNKPTIPSAPGTLVTNASTAQTASSGEAMSGSITLHKVSKTGSYNDLLNKPGFKTVNNNSLLGSGNISVQETLVSGTNIKTIFGQSLLGSGAANLPGIVFYGTTSAAANWVVDPIVPATGFTEYSCLVLHFDSDVPASNSGTIITVGGNQYGLAYHQYFIKDAGVIKRGDKAFIVCYNTIAHVIAIDRWGQDISSSSGGFPSYSGNAGKFLAVNSGETGVEWKTVSGGDSGTLVATDDNNGNIGLSISGGTQTLVATDDNNGNIGLALN